MGQFKPLLPLAEQSLLEIVIESLRPAVDSIIVVTGHLREKIEPVARSLGAQCVHNIDYETGGMISSIQAGLRTCRGEASGVILALVDQPLVQSTTIEQVAHSWRDSRATMVIPTHGAARGHPVAIDCRAIDSILSLNANQTLKTFRDRSANELLEIAVDDPGVTMDLDTPADYEWAVEWAEERAVQKLGQFYGSVSCRS